MKEGIIDNYSDISVGQYLEITRIAKEERDDLDRQVAILAVLYGCTEDDILDLPLAEYKRRAEASQFLEAPCPRLPKVAERYTLGDMTLVPSSDPAAITAGQYIDFQTFAAEGEEKIVEQLSCFLIPEGCKYGKGYDVRDVQKAIRDHLSVADVLALAAFFLGSWTKLIEAIRTSSEKANRRRVRRKAPTS